MTLSRRRFVQALVCTPWLSHARAQSGSPQLLATISGPEAVQALRDSLAAGARNAIAALGKENGFYADPKLKIGLPKNFARSERFLRSVGYGRKLDALVLAMNRAAETATPLARDLVLDSIKQMNVADAKAILTGGEQAATEYFRKTSEAKLAETLLPIIKSVTEKSDLARTYNSLASSLAKFGLGTEGSSVESYVNKKALDGIYFRIGEEERMLRSNPSQYAGSLLEKVFGLLK